MAAPNFSSVSMNIRTTGTLVYSRNAIYFTSAVVGSTRQRNRSCQHIGMRSEAKGFSWSSIELISDGIPFVPNVAR